MPKLLSKSKYLNGLQCSKLLWVALNEPERLPEIAAATQHIFDQGHLVGELARKLFPGGIAIPAEDFLGNITATREALRQRRPIFEAGIRANNLFARADILKPSGDSAWDIIEVKSSTGVKDIHIQDAAFQKHCYQQAGLEINRCYLMHINNQYVRRGEVDPSQLFTTVDITEDVMLVLGSVPERVAEMLAVTSATLCPEATIGPQCRDPYECALTECWEGLPEHNVFTLYYGGKKSQELYNRGVLGIADIPAGDKLNEKQSIQRVCVINNEPHIDRGAIRQFLSSLQYPLYFLDFETINPAVPLFDGTRPYQNTPFQFSLHVQAIPGGETKHSWHLADGPQDPRPELLARLQQATGDEGSIVVYNQSFEQSVLQDLGTTFPAYRGWSQAVIARLVDLIIPFRSFHYYHPAQRGSASIKHVLPAVTGSGYEGLAIAQGNDASRAYLTMTYGGTPEAEKAAVRDDLLKYCGRDTDAMVNIVGRLGELSR